MQARCEARPDVGGDRVSVGPRKPAVIGVESFTRGVLARRRLVVVLWVVLTLVGLALSGPRSMRSTSGSACQVARAGRPTSRSSSGHGNGGDQLPLLAVVALAADARNRPRVRNDLRRIEAPDAGQHPGFRIVGIQLDRRRGLSFWNDGGVAFACASPPSPDPFGGNVALAKRLEQRMASVEVAGAPVPVRRASTR